MPCSCPRSPLSSPSPVSGGGWTAGLRRISQEILAHHGALLSTPKGHEQLLLALCQGYVIWTNPLYPGPGRDRRCQRLLSTEALRQTAENAVFEGSAMRRGDT